MSTIAEQIVDKAVEIKAERADQEAAEIKGGWAWQGNRDSGEAFVATLRGISFWAGCDQVVACAPHTWSGRVHSSAGSEILDAACQDFDLPETARIDSHGDYNWVLSW